MRPAIYLGAILTFAGCIKSEEVRRVTYPPSFQYLSDAEIRGTMGALARHVASLDQLMAQGEPLPSDQRRIVATLEAMQTLVRELTKGEQSNHPSLDDTAPILALKVDRALFGARRTPPNYYFAGTVSGACVYCHAPRHKAGVEDTRPNARAQHPNAYESRPRLSYQPPSGGVP